MRQRYEQLFLDLSNYISQQIASLETTTGKDRYVRFAKQDALMDAKTELFRHLVVKITGSNEQRFNKLYRDMDNYLTQQIDNVIADDNATQPVKQGKLRTLLQLNDELVRLQLAIKTTMKGSNNMAEQKTAVANLAKEKHLDTQMMDLQNEMNECTAIICNLTETIGEFGPMYDLDRDGKQIESTVTTSAVAKALVIQQQVTEITRLAIEMDKVQAEWDALELD